MARFAKLLDQLVAADSRLRYDAERAEVEQVAGAVIALLVVAALLGG